jgi:NADH-quinone oxidoreductase subunit I
MKGFTQYFKDLFYGIRSLWTGMKVTGHYIVRPKEIVTQQYPENRETLKMFERFKGELTMPHDANNTHRCTSCGICEMNCPNGSIEVISKFEVNEEGKKKKALDTYIYHLEMCTFCDLCVKTCPSDAIKFANIFEHAVWDRSKLTKVLNMPGSVCAKDIKE